MYKHANCNVTTFSSLLLKPEYMMGGGEEQSPSIHLRDSISQIHLRILFKEHLFLNKNEGGLLWPHYLTKTEMSPVHLNA